MFLLVVTLSIFSSIFNKFSPAAEAFALRSNDAHSSSVSSHVTHMKPVNTTHLFNYEDKIIVPNFLMNRQNTYKRSYMKKSPKRTIQKFIKSRRAKKLMFIEATNAPTVAEYNQDDEFDKEQSTELTTAQTIHTTKKYFKKKWTPQETRLMNKPFSKYNKYQDLQHRLKRDTGVTDREFYILQDLDEMQFISGEDGDNNEVVAHIKNYWK